MERPTAATICEASLLRNSLATSPDSPLAEQSLATNHVDDMHQPLLVALDYPTRGFNNLAIQYRSLTATPSASYCIWNMPL